MYLGCDLGTGGCKAVLVDADGKLIAHEFSPCTLQHPNPGWAEQDPEEWWTAVCASVRAVLQGREASEVRAMAVAGQMLALVPMDGAGNPTRPALSWLDHRADPQARRIIRRLGGERVLGAIAGGVPTGKDLVAKLAWLAECEPEMHAATAAYGDATSYLVARCTGRLAMDPTAAGGTGMFNLEERRWSRLLTWLVSFPTDKMPEVVPSTDVAGRLHEKAAANLGLPVGLPVAMGMADIPAAAVGSGATGPGQAHVYLGTSSWIGVSLDRPASRPRAGIASVPSASRSGCLLIAESETAGACRDWFGRELGEFPEELADQAPPGSDGLLFCPWLFGERSPYPSAHLRGAFVNLTLTHTRAHMARAVLEGTALNLRWILEEIDITGQRSPGLRAIGGGARSDVWLQILADVTGEVVERVEAPQHAGAVGAALLSAVAIGDLAGLSAASERVRVETRFTPVKSRVYEPLYVAMRQLAPALEKAGSRWMNR